MYCRKCLKEGDKVNMHIEIEEKRYICPECRHVVNWSTEEEN